MIEDLPTKLHATLAHFHILGTIGKIVDGPLLTEVEYKLMDGAKFSYLKSLVKDIGRELGVSGVRVSEIPNSVYICFEIPQQEVKTISFPALTYSANFLTFKGDLPICIGVDMRANPVMKDLAKMPHLLVAGTTGSGKSVGLNSFILTLIAKKKPDELQFILIDPKRIEFSMYNNTKYMMRPTITDMNLASICLNQLASEMESRYELFEKEMVRNISEYKAKGHKMPYIVCIIDEFADLIMFDKSVEKQVQILAQKSRAAGIHLIIATQRPSVDVITGSIKANLPTRLSYKVASTTDSQTILNAPGAESLFGKGDSLLLEQDGTLTRILGAYVSNDDIMNALENYRCKMPEEKKISFNKKTKDPQDTTSQSSEGIFAKISALWNRIGRRNQTKIINGVINFLLIAIGMKNKSSNNKKK